MRTWPWVSIASPDPAAWIRTLNLRLKELSGVVSRGHKSVAKTAAYTLGWSDELVLVDATAGAVTITLPPAAQSRGQRVVVKKTDASGNAVTVDGSGAETIDGAATAALAAQYDSVDIQSDGTSWWKV